MKNNVTPFFASIILFMSCKENKTQSASISGPAESLTEFSGIYTAPEKNVMYSKNVKDTFTIFTSAPSVYNKDSAKCYPLIILLDANAFFEPVMANAKLSTFIGDMEESIVAGVGYNNFPALDSLRSRDYTYPAAIPEYEMALSGGADRFKDFLDKELLPHLEAQYKIDTGKIILAGHSLGGYFTLYYFLRSAQQNRFAINNFISASPSLFYNNNYLFRMEDSIAAKQKNIRAKLYISMGSRDMEDTSVKNILGAFAAQVNKHHYTGLRLRAEEYSNFGHIDAALPGFSKGLAFIFAKQ